MDTFLGLWYTKEKINFQVQIALYRNEEQNGKEKFDTFNRFI